MAVKTPFTPDDFVAILSQYDLGDYAHSEAIQRGTVQTNYCIRTTQGRFVFGIMKIVPKKPSCLRVICSRISQSIIIHVRFRLGMRRV